LEEIRGWWNDLCNLWERAIRAWYASMETGYMGKHGRAVLRPCRVSVLKPWLSSRLFGYIAS
jgi:hypothetical protein